MQYFIQCFLLQGVVAGEVHLTKEISTTMATQYETTKTATQREDILTTTTTQCEVSNTNHPSGPSSIDVNEN